MTIFFCYLPYFRIDLYKLNWLRIWYHNKLPLKYYSGVKMCIWPKITSGSTICSTASPAKNKRNKKKSNAIWRHDANVSLSVRDWKTCRIVNNLVLPVRMSENILRKFELFLCFWTGKISNGLPIICWSSGLAIPQKFSIWPCTYQLSFSLSPSPSWQHDGWLWVEGLWSPPNSKLASILRSWKRSFGYNALIWLTCV